VKALELAQLAQAHHPQHGTDRALPHRQEGSCDQHLCVSPHALGKHGLEDQITFINSAGNVGMACFSA
jgi:hypothetical protein